jgi:hypothetical protein
METPRPCILIFLRPNTLLLIGFCEQKLQINYAFLPVHERGYGGLIDGLVEIFLLYVGFYLGLD